MLLIDLPCLCREDLLSWRTSHSSQFCDTKRLAWGAGGHWLFCGPADNGGDQLIGSEKPLGDPLHIFQRHSLNQRITLGDVVDAQILDLNPQELTCDAGRNSKRSAYAPVR